MEKTFILFNPLAGGGQCRQLIDPLKETYPDAPFVDMSQIDSYASFFGGLDDSDRVILCGGDGTLNRFANDTRDITVKNELYLYPVGSGNDFARDIDNGDGTKKPLHINEYLRNLPRVTVNGKEWVFINGVGFGIDGYCCEVGDQKRDYNREHHIDKPINYTGIVIKGLLFHFKPCNATVTVDGVKHSFRKVWIAPTMNGHYYGGGMMPTPDQDRLNTDNTVTCMLMHGTGKLKTLMIFPSLFKGEHIRHTTQVDIWEGQEITVEFDRPTALQIDGETIKNVTSYTAVASAKVTKSSQNTFITV